MPAEPDWALDEEMVTIRPQPALSMSGTTACTLLKVPVRLTRIMSSHASIVSSVNGTTSAMPALVTMISTAPNAACTSSSAAAMLDRSVTSTPCPLVSSPLSRITAAASVAASASMSQTATRCPALPRC